MKRSLLLCLLLVNFCSGTSQTNVYHPFPDSNAVWVNWWSNVCSGQSMVQCNSDYQYILKGDTVISGQKYAKLYSEGWWSSCVATQWGYTCSAPTFSSVFRCGIRNDTTARKVYYNSGAEYLLYDFSLNVGDTVKGQVGYDGVISRIDSVLVGGNFRKRFLVNSIGVYSILEGIGLVDIDTSGSGYWAELFMGGPCVCPSFWAFSCFWQDGQHLYGDTTCQLISSLPEINSQKELRVFPNPAYSEITIEVPGELAYSLHTGLGRLLLSGRSKKIDVSGLPPGIYFLSFSNGYRQKIIIQR